MGQAKIRREEIKALKAKKNCAQSNIGNQINLIAIKHCKNGNKTIAVIDLQVSDCKKSRDQLLKEICTQEWKNLSNFQKITNYFSMSSNYQLYKILGMYGFAINFYECDQDFYGAYSCREIVAIRTKDSFDLMVKSEIENSNVVSIY
jgi:hypothetical protein